MTKNLIDIPLNSLSRALLYSGQSLEASGIYMSAVMSMLARGRPLPADDAKAAAIVRADVRVYRRVIAELISEGVMLRLESGEVSAPIIAECRPARARNIRRSRSAIPSATKDAVLAKTSGRCAYCAVHLTLDASNPTSFEVDHVLAVSLGGSDDVANLIPACRACNNAKRAGTALRFMGGGAA